MFFDILPNYLEKGDYVIDVGANIGFYTREFSRLVGRNGRVMALEPFKKHFEN